MERIEETYQQAINRLCDEFEKERNLPEVDKITLLRISSRIVNRLKQIKMHKEEESIIEHNLKEDLDLVNSWVKYKNLYSSFNHTPNEVLRALERINIKTGN